MRRLKALLLIPVAIACMAAASDPREQLADPALEARARGVFKEVRCLVCQNETIDDSHAPLAADLRRVVREQITAGRSDGQVKDFLIQRYGEFVLFKPRFSPGNAILWLAPFVIVLGGLAVTLGLRRRTVSDEPLNAEEQALVSSLTQADGSVTLPPHARPTNALDA